MIPADPADDLTYDEYDARLIEDWLAAPGLQAPVPYSSREVDGITYVYENAAAWPLVDKATLPIGLSLSDARHMMAMREPLGPPDE
jgi:hypothetical protein